MKRELLSAAQASEYTTLAESTLRKMAWERRIRSFKVLRSLRFLKEDLDAMITERPSRPSRPAEQTETAA